MSLRRASFRDTCKMSYALQRVTEQILRTVFSLFIGLSLKMTLTGRVGLWLEGWMGTWELDLKLDTKLLLSHI